MCGAGTSLDWAGKEERKGDEEGRREKEKRGERRGRWRRGEVMCRIEDVEMANYQEVC